jgi:hypothetical protein
MSRPPGFPRSRTRPGRATRSTLLGERAASAFTQSEPPVYRSSARPLQQPGEKTARDYERLPRRRAAFFAGAGASSASALARRAGGPLSPLPLPPPGEYLNDTLSLAR